MTQTPETLQRIHERIIYHFSLPESVVSSDAKEQARETLRESAAFRKVSLQPDGYEQFLLEYIQRELRSFHDGPRESDICGCDDPECPLKDERIPRAVRQADRIDTGIRDFRNQHGGEPIVLTEAQEQWRRTVQEVQDTLLSALQTLTSSKQAQTGADTPAAGDD